MIRGGFVAAAGLVLLVQTAAFMPPHPQAAACRGVAMKARQDSNQGEGKKSMATVGVSVLGRSLAATGILLSTFLGGGLQGAWAAPATTADKQTVNRQVRTTPHECVQIDA